MLVLYTFDVYDVDNYDDDVRGDIIIMLVWVYIKIIEKNRVMESLCVYNIQKRKKL